MLSEAVKQYTHTHSMISSLSLPKNNKDVNITQESQGREQIEGQIYIIAVYYYYYCEEQLIDHIFILSHNSCQDAWFIIYQTREKWASN